MAGSTKIKTVGKVWNTAAYIRLSREDRDLGTGDKTASESVTNQKQLIGDFIRSQPDLGEYLTFIDDGLTGTNFNRQGFQDMMTEIKNGNINCVVVKDLSRFGRNYTEAGMYMEQIFPMFGVRFIAINDHIDSYLRPSEMDSILVPLKNLLNDSYSRDLSVKIRSAVTAIRRRGEFIGAFAAFGYLKDPEDGHRLIIDPEAAPVVQDIFTWYVEGMGKNKIAKTLNAMGIPSPAKYRIQHYPSKKRYNQEYAQEVAGLWSIQSVHGVLQNPVYCGHMAQGKRTFVSYKNNKQVVLPKEEWIIAENTHEPIISVELFQKAQEQLALRARPMPDTGKLHLFSGFLSCGDCRRSMTRTHNKMRNGELYIYYRCSTRYRLSKTACTSHIISEKDLTEAVLKAVQIQISLLADAEAVLESLDTEKRRLSRQTTIDCQKERLQKEYDSMENLKLGLYADLKRGILTEEEYIALKSSYIKRMEEIDSAMEELGAERKNLDEVEEIQNSVLEHFRTYRNVDRLTRELLAELVERIYIYEEKRISIEFKFQDQLARLFEMAREEQNKTA